MPVNDFWGAIAGDPALLSQTNTFVSPELLKAALLDLVGVGMNAATVRGLFGLTQGVARGDEFDDLRQTLNNLPGTGAAGRQLKAYCVDKIISAARLANQQNALPGNPYVTANALRLQARAVLVQEGATPLVGSLVSAT